MKKPEPDMPDSVAFMMTTDEASMVLHALSYPMKDEEIQCAMFPGRKRSDTFVTTCRQLKAALKEEAAIGSIGGAIAN